MADINTVGDQIIEPVIDPIDRISEQRAKLRVRHALALTALMDERDDLRGVHALADYFDEAVRWSA